MHVCDLLQLTVSQVNIKMVVYWISFKALIEDKTLQHEHITFDTYCIKSLGTSNSVNFSEFDTTRTVTRLATR